MSTLLLHNETPVDLNRDHPSALQWSHAGETQRSVCSPEAEWVGESHSASAGAPGLCCAGHIVQVKLWFGAVQVEGGRQDAVVTREGSEGGLQRSSRSQQMTARSFSGGHGQWVRMLPKQSLNGSVLRGVSERRGSGVSVDIRHVWRRHSSITESSSHAPETQQEKLINTLLDDPCNYIQAYERVAVVYFY